MSAAIFSILGMSGSYTLIRLLLLQGVRRVKISFVAHGMGSGKT